MSEKKSSAKSCKNRLSAVAMLMTLLMPVAVLAQDRFADRVLLDAKVYTVDPATPDANTIAVKEGKFVYVGDRAGGTAWIGPDTLVESLNGKLVLPGLIDGHTHPGILSLFASTDLVVAPEEDPVALLRWLGNYARSNPEIPFIIAGFWRTADFGIEGPHKDLIDREISDRPVALMDDSGHSMWLNSKALDIMGIHSETPDPAPGLAYYQRDEKGELTGWIKEFSSAPIQERVLKTANTEVFKSNLRKFLNYLSGQGITALYDGGNLGLHDKVYTVLAEMDREGRLPVRYEGSYHVHLPEQIDKAIPELKRLRNTYAGHRLQFNTIKIHFDGVHEIRTSALLEEFTDDPGNHGGTLIDEERLVAFIRELHQEKIDLHMHVVGDAATRLALDAYESAREKDWDYPRLTLCHLELVNDIDIPRFRELGVVANFTPHWFGDLFQGAAPSLGERNEQKMRAKSFFEAGAIVSFSSDVVVPEEQERATPFLGMQIGMNRQDLEGASAAKIMQPVSERLALTQLIQGYTAHGAYQLRKSGSLGSITPGKSADLVIMEDDLFALKKYQIHTARVSRTMLDGEFVFKATEKHPKQDRTDTGVLP